MGGGGNYGSYDVPDRSAKRTSRGTTDFAEKKMSRSNLDPVMQPKNRRLTCGAKSPVVLACDVTGSMDVLPKIFLAKAPMAVREIVTRGYLDDPAVSVCGIGDVISDGAPLQFGEFAPPNETGDWLARIYPEGNGGGQGVESYEFAAWFYAQRCTLTNADVPFFFFTGDEGFRESLTTVELNEYFGGESEKKTATQVFKELRRKFKNNVFLIHRRFAGNSYRTDKMNVDQWEGVLGADHVIKLQSDQAVADVILGVIAVVGGGRTLEEYCNDMATRTNVNTGELDPQSPERIAEIRSTLKDIEQLMPQRKKQRSSPTTSKTKVKSPTSQQDDQAAPTSKPKKKKSGRI